MTDERAMTRRALLSATAGATAAGTAGCAVVTTPADVAASGESLGNFGYAVSAAWLDEHDEYLPIDARSRELFRLERIYGARHVPTEAITARRETPEGLVPDAGAIADAFADAGVGRDDDVVVYGASVGSRVTRTVFALEHLGHEGDVRVLNGGFEAWNGRIGTGAARPRSASYDPAPRDDAVVTRTWIAERLGSFNADGGPGLVDVRAPDAYLAKEGARDPALARHGHLPGAMDVHWFGNVDGRRFREPGQLAELYFSAAGIAEDWTVVVYGTENVNPTHTYVTLKALGVEDVRLYDGGFAEWTNVPGAERGRYPVETKTRAVVETEGELDSGSGGFSCTG